MDALFCDELLQEIFYRIPPPYVAALSLVSKRWCRLLRSSTTSLSLRFPPPYDPTTVADFSLFLTLHPFLSSLCISGAGNGGEDSILLAVASSCPNLRCFRFSSCPVSSSSLCNLSSCCTHLSSIDITVARPLCFNWLRYFTSLKCLSLSLINSSADFDNIGGEETMDVEFDAKLNLESLSLCGILAGDHGISVLLRNCRSVKKLQLKNCTSLGDFSGFVRLLSNLHELELRTCRSICNIVLLKVAETCVSLDSLLVYDGGSREGLLNFINHCRCSLRRLDLRLPLDLDNNHLIALSENVNFRGLVSLRLQSCCLVTAEGLKALGTAVSNELQELALINCDALEREPGLLASLGQNFKRLRRLDLSYNDMLVDKALMSMLASANCLIELKLRGCNRLTNIIAGLLVRCKQLQHVDITCCNGIEMEGVESLVLRSPRLRTVEVEQSKLSEVARAWAMNKFIGIVS